MTDTIRFERHRQLSQLHNPMMGGQLDTQQIELRRDPLTGRPSAFNPRLQDKVAMFHGASDEALIERLAEAGRERCFLCEDRWMRMTPTYPDVVIPSGRVQVGSCVLFPNLFPVAQVHAVVRVGDVHHLRLDAFDPSLLHDAFSAALQFVRALARAEPSARHLTLSANYLHPAGASIAHPHFQVVGGDLPLGTVAEMAAACRQHRDAHGSDFWPDLVDAEREAAERVIDDVGPVTWIAAFSPRGANEVLGVLPARRHLLQLDDTDVTALCKGVSCVLKGYRAMGVSTFNFTLFSGPMGAGDDPMRCVMRIISRQNVYENYRTDDYFLQKQLGTELILTPPEQLAAMLRRSFE